MNCAWCGKSAILDKDPKKLFCNRCRVNFAWDDIEIQIFEMMLSRGYYESKKRLQVSEDKVFNVPLLKAIFSKKNVQRERSKW